MSFLRPAKAVCILTTHDAQGPQRKLRALSFVAPVIGLTRCLRQHRVNDLADELLLRLRQAAQLFKLLLQLRCRPTLARLGRFADQFLDAGTQRLGQQRQGGHRNASASDLERCDLLLRDADDLAQLRLGEVVGLAALGNAGAELSKKGGLVRRHWRDGAVVGRCHNANANVR